MRRMARMGTVVALAAGFASGFAAAATAQTAGSTGTHTTLTVETSEIGGRTVATLSATVLADDGTPATGALAVVDSSKGLNTDLDNSIAGAALDAHGKVEIQLSGLSEGDHVLRAMYLGDSAHAASQSEVATVSTGTPPANGFELSISSAVLPASGQPAISPGDTSVPITVTITPGSSFTGFLSLSCSGPPTATNLPVGVSCTFTPLNLQVTKSTVPVTADMTIQTQAPQLISSAPNAGRNTVQGTGSPLVLAVLLPGVIGLGLLGRKRKLLGRTALLLMIGGLSLLGTTACAARYRYLHHGPTFGGTPTGTFTIEVIAQTSNGVTASSQSLPLTLTVK
jgi:Bacterial Ig-like domain (group 3)